MKKYLNTLFVTTQGAYLSKEGESVVVSVEREVRMRIPVHTLGGIVGFGNVMCSPFLMHHCAQNNVLISFLSENGRFLARVSGPVNGNVLLRRRQYRMADDPAECVRLAQSFLLGKAANARTVLMRAARDHGGKDGMEAVEQEADQIGGLMRGLQRDDDLDVVRGKEGDISRRYFSVFDRLITAQKEAFFFRERNRRPPLDNMNALLSFIYTLLAHDCTGALEAVGLDPQVGFLHRDRSGRPSLALDLMEEFRPFFADRLALSLVNLRQVQANGFKQTESGAVEMTDDTRKSLLVAYQKRKQEEMVHPFLNESAPLGLFFHLQALLLARYIRGDIDGYPPVIWK
ncbi:MAG TPA: subtype I-C CRISPR-associated endonuclease Cas1 [Verrucomicrobia bacterium]|nr:subtype I-C CRISPR-associated endonuclease Cas1 [Verrucomicrobiota bacterium]